MYSNTLVQRIVTHSHLGCKVFVVRFFSREPIMIILGTTHHIIALKLLSKCRAPAFIYWQVITTTERQTPYLIYTYKFMTKATIFLLVMTIKLRLGNKMTWSQKVHVSYISYLKYNEIKSIPLSAPLEINLKHKFLSFCSVTAFRLGPDAERTGNGVMTASDELQWGAQCSHPLETIIFFPLAFNFIKRR